jgi:hypothetical protein
MESETEMQHVSHRTSDEIAELRAEVERLKAAIGNRADLGEVEDMRQILAAAEAALATAREAMQPVCNYAWSAVTADCEEARVYLNELIANLRAALSALPPALETDNGR